MLSVVVSLMLSVVMLNVVRLSVGVPERGIQKRRRHGIQHNDTQHKELTSDYQHKTLYIKIQYHYY